MLTKNIFERLTFYELDGLREVTSSFYSSLEKELSEYEAYVNKRINEMPQKFHDEFLDHMSDDYRKYSDDFPEAYDARFSISP